MMDSHRENELPMHSWELARALAEWAQYALEGSEMRVIWFVFARTYAWGKTSDWISETQALKGIPGQIAPLNMSKSTYYRVVDDLIKKDILHKNVKKGKPYYSINIDWNLLKWLPDEFFASLTGETGESHPRDRTIRELTIRDIARVTRARAQGASSNVNSEKCNMGSPLDAVRSAATAASMKSKGARDKRKDKLNATGLYKIWQDAFREAYPTERMFAWREYELPAFKKAIARGVPTSEILDFVKYCVTHYDNVITTQFGWMKGVSKTPSPSFVIKHIERFYTAFHDHNDPNRKVRQRIATAPVDAVSTVTKDEATSDRVKELEQETAALKRKLHDATAAKAKQSRRRIRRLIDGKASNETLSGPFRKWD